MSRKLIVRYLIAGVEYFAGPYDVEEAVDQAQDISGYEGVTNVWADDAQHPTMPLREELATRLQQRLEELKPPALPPTIDSSSRFLST